VHSRSVPPSRCCTMGHRGPGRWSTAWDRPPPWDPECTGVRQTRDCRCRGSRCEQVYQWRCQVRQVHLGESLRRLRWSIWASKSVCLLCVILRACWSACVTLWCMVCVFVWGEMRWLWVSAGMPHSSRSVASRSSGWAANRSASARTGGGVHGFAAEGTMRCCAFPTSSSSFGSGCGG
jgi:hypothetical protein